MMISSFRKLFSFALGFVVLCAVLGQVAPAQNDAHPVKFDSGTISGLNARNTGSAAMSGRIAAIDAFDDNGKVTVFVGSASGGVWESINGATTFQTVFDPESGQSMSAVTVGTSNHQIIWVRNDGAGVRRST